MLAVKNPSANAGNARDRDMDLTPGSGRSHGEGNDNPLQYSCLGNLMEIRAWWAIVHEIARVRHNLATKPPSNAM